MEIKNQIVTRMLIIKAEARQSKKEFRKSIDDDYKYKIMCNSVDNYRDLRLEGLQWVLNILETRSEDKD